MNVSSADVFTNLTGVIPGPLNSNAYVPFVAPNTSAVGAGGGSVFIGPGLNTSFTAALAPTPVNLTQQNETSPWSGPRIASTNSSSNGSGKSSGAVDVKECVIGATIFGTILAGVATLLV